MEPSGTEPAKSREPTRQRTRPYCRRMSLRLHAVLATALLTALLCVVGTVDTASAAWAKPGKCHIPAKQRDVFEQLDNKNNLVVTKRVPCWMASFAVEDMLNRAPWTKRSFRFTSMGARWYLKLSCKSRAHRDDAPQPGHIISCRVRKGVDGEAGARRRNLRGGTIHWVTAYTA